MKRRDFIKTSAGTAAAISVTSLHPKSLIISSKPVQSFPRYRGFNLTQKTGGNDPKRKFDEEDFEIITEFGFDFARIPMSYWN